MWNPIAEFVVIGQPVPQPRPRAFAKAFGKGKDGKVKFSARVYDSGTAEAWKQEVALAAQPFMPDVPYDCVLSIGADFYLKRPQRLCRKKDPRGAIVAAGHLFDGDNLLKAVMDALTVIQFWKDDRYVVGWGGRKFYAPIDGRTGALIRIEKWTGEIAPGPQHCPIELCPDVPL